MKHILTLLALCCALVSYGQKYEYKGIKNFPLNTETSRVTYDSVVVVEGKNAIELYNAALLWIGKNSDLEIKTQQNGEFISGNGLTATTETTRTKYTFTISFKEGRYKYELSNFVVIYRSGSERLEDFFPSHAKGKAAELNDKKAIAINQALHLLNQNFAVAGVTSGSVDW